MTKSDNTFAKIIYQDEDLLALDKPVGVVVNRSITHSGETVQDLVESLNVLADDPTVESEFLDRSGIVHRIDKDTSGILLVAKNVAAFTALQQQFKDRGVKKEYRAIVFGVTPVGKFKVSASIERNPKNRVTMAIIKGGKPSVTDFETLQSFELDGQKYSYIRAMPTTGRTHQIRVHLTALNCPVVGDPIYSSKTQQERALSAFTRMMLHALSIEFIHPTQKSPLKLETQLPVDFSKYLIT